MSKKKLLYVITEDWFFCSHFLERASAARDAGYAVSVLANEGQHGEAVRSAGLELIPASFRRRGVNPLSEARSLKRIFDVYRQQRPDIVHHIGLKPILYGTLAARLLGIRHVLNAPVGMGYVFSSTDFLARLLKPLVKQALAMLLNPRGSKVVFENQDDLDYFAAHGAIRRESAVLIRGAGVNLSQFQVSGSARSVPVVALCARMLRDKGVFEFVEAARLLQHLKAHFWLVGAPDPGNPAAIDESVLRQWDLEGVVRWRGFSDNMAALLQEVDVACLPSYREGLPKSLLEALAAGKAIVSTDVPGCREVVRHEYNGLLVPAKDAPALAAALASLIADPALRERFGINGRAMAEKEFASDIVIKATLEQYASFTVAEDA